MLWITIQEQRSSIISPTAKIEIKNSEHSLHLYFFPTVFAVLGAFTPDIHKDYGDLITFVVWVIVVVAFLLSAMRYNISEPAAIGLVVENEDLEKGIESLERDLEQLQDSISILSMQSSYSKSIRATILEYKLAENKVTNLEDLRSMIDALSSTLYIDGEFIFGLGSSELWNFAVYLYSEDNRNLVPVWREKSRNHPSTDMGRIWNPGEGHVGKAFVDQKSIITEDAREDGVSEFSATPPGKNKAYDQSAYVSFAAIPIGPILIKDTRPYGVIVGTSDRPGRFDVEKAGILEHIAGAIAAALITGDLDIDTLCEIPEPATAPGSEAHVEESRAAD